MAFAQTPDKTVGLPDVAPVLVDIARCESGYRQFDSDGKVLVGPTKDRGYFQISPSKARLARKMGYNIDTEKGNIAFALWLYKKYGTRPWDSSKHCWQKGSSVD